MSSTSVTVGGSVTVTVTVANQGTGNAAATTTMIRVNNNPSSSSPSDPLQQGVATPAINAGSSTMVSATFTLSTAGTYYAHAYVDNYGVLTQSNTSNDSAHSQAITVSAATQPDLTPSSVTLSTTSLTAGGSVTVTVTVKNQGTGNAGATTMIRLNNNPSSSSPSDPIQQGMVTPAINTGGSANVSATFTLSAAGTYYAHVYVDNNSVLTQSNTSNDSYHSGAITMTASTTALTTLTVNGSNFSTSGGHLQFTDPNGVGYSSAAHPERVVSVTSTQWIYQVNNGGTEGTWQVRVVNTDGQTSNAASFTVR